MKVHPEPQPDAAFTNRLTGAFRGGLILLAGATLWFFFLPQRNDPFFELLFSWLPSAWLIFAVGALWGYFLDEMPAGGGWAKGLALSVLLGVAGGVILASGFWFVRNHNELIGLVANRHGAGYLRYSFSVRHHLLDEAWRVFYGVVPVSAIWICAWTLWARLKAANMSPMPRNPSPTIHLGLDARLLRPVGWLAAGLAILATAVLLLTALFSRGVSVPFWAFLVVGPAAAGLVILGPFLGPAITGSSAAGALNYTAVALPLILGALTPFRFCRRPLRRGLAVAAWCAFVTALLFWTAAGAVCLARCLG